MLRSSLRRRFPSTTPPAAPATHATIEVLRAAFGTALAPDALAALAPFADVVEVGPGTSLARAGVVPRQMTVLLDGRALVRQADGAQWIAGPGDRFGEDEVRQGVALRVSVTTVGPSSRVLVVFGPAVGWAVAGLLTPPAGRPAHLARGRDARHRTTGAADHKGGQRPELRAGPSVWSGTAG